MKLLLLAVLLCASAHAAEPAWFDARATLQRAQVGTYSPRAAAPVKVEVKPAPRRGPRTRAVERMTCRPDPTQPSNFICEYPAP